MTELSKPDEEYKWAANLLKALSNEKRVKIVCVLRTQGEQCVGELERKVGLSQSALSQHLARLRHDDLVITRRSAQTIFYSINKETVEKLLKWLGTTF